MNGQFTYSQLLQTFPTNESCLEEFKKLRFPKGVFCKTCKRITKHYKLKGRTAYSCKYCRTQVFPLAGTILEKTTTPLTIWFYTFFIMTHTRSQISIKDLQRELGVTYKAAWRMHKNIKVLMSKNNGDLLRDSDIGIIGQKQPSTHRWTFFSKLEITVTQKEEHAD